MNKIIEFFKNKKTYIVAAVGVIVNGMNYMGYISPDMIPLINVILGFLGLATLRSGIGNK